jgi:hypothetical protein
MRSAMSEEFYDGFMMNCGYIEWMAYLGCPMLYDGGLCVNREPQEVEYHNKRRFINNLSL